MNCDVQCSALMRVASMWMAYMRMAYMLHDAGGLVIRELMPKTS